MNKRVLDVVFESHLEGDLKWSKPCNGWIKANVDVALFSYDDRYGVGCILRNREGAFIGSFQNSVAGCLAPK